ncbi:MAG: hypothetical protein RL637_734 [Pseudomonadota bacterium]|jgi:hypothetical protein
MKPQFIIGVGSQRAGSTLLHRLLETSSEIYMHPIKELHYFDTLFNVRKETVLHKFSLNQLNHEIERLVKAKNFAFMNKRYKNALRANFLLATKKVQQIDYVDLFRPCIQGHQLLGEITPEYMILPPIGIRKMRELTGNSKIILIARNPVKRFVSAFKLLTHGTALTHSQFEQELLKTLQHGGEWLAVQDALNDYETALFHYRQEFSQVLFISHDELIGSIETATKLSQFLGVELSLNTYQKTLSHKINALDETKDLSPETLHLLKNRYLKQQVYLDHIFGHNHCVA